MKDKEQRLTPQCRAIWKLLKRGYTLDQTKTQPSGLGWKLSSRCGEIERVLGIVLNRGWLTTGGGAKIRTYRWRP